MHDRATTLAAFNGQWKMNKNVYLVDSIRMYAVALYQYTKYLRRLRRNE